MWRFGSDRRGCEDAAVQRDAQVCSGRHTHGIRSVAAAAKLLAICLPAAPVGAASDDDWLSPAYPPESAEVDQELGGGEDGRDWYRTPLAVTYLVPLTVMSYGIATNGGRDTPNRGEMALSVSSNRSRSTRRCR